MDKNVWGPPYWFTLHTIAMTYPEFPNETIKKKYYDFIQNIPLFIPNRNMGMLLPNHCYSKLLHHIYLIDCH